MTKSNDKATVYSIELDQAEMAIRIVEGMTGAPRPVGMSAKDALEHLDENVQEQLHGASKMLAEYFFEQMKKVIPTTELHKHSNHLN